jgi:hypothetical protein
MTIHTAATGTIQLLHAARNDVFIGLTGAGPAVVEVQSAEADGAVVWRSYANLTIPANECRIVELPRGAFRVTAGAGDIIDVRVP